MKLHRLHVATLSEWEGPHFKLYIHKYEKILDFYSEQGQLFCFVVSPNNVRNEYGNLQEIDPEIRKKYCVVEKRCELPSVEKIEDLKFIKIIPPRWALFEIINLEELGKQGVEGFNFLYPGLLREPGDLWKAIAKRELEKDA
jgi:hypothetical protein